MKCVKCNSEIDNDALFCPYCGNPVEHGKVCVKCGKPLDDDSNFCPYCGTKQNDLPVESEQINEEVVLPNEPDVTQKEVVDELLKPEIEELSEAAKVEEPPMPEVVEQPQVPEVIADVDNVSSSIPEEKDSADIVDPYIENHNSKKWLWIVGAILILAVLFGGGYYMSNKQGVQPNVIDTDSIAEDKDSIVIDNQSDEDNNNISFSVVPIDSSKKTSEIETSISIDFPQTDNATLNENIAKFIVKVLTEDYTWGNDKPRPSYKGSLNDGNAIVEFFVNEKVKEISEEWKNDIQAAAWQENISIKLIHESQRFISYEIDYGGDHGGVAGGRMYGVTFNKENGNIVNILQEPIGSQLKKLLIARIESIDKDGLLFKDEYLAHPIPERKPFLVSDGVRFIYQRYEIGSGIAGIVDFTVPLSVIKPYMTKEAMSFITMDDVAATSDLASGDQKVKSFTVNGVSFKMIRVEGGTFTMGDTPEQKEDDYGGNTQRVTLSTYFVGETEVTQELWQAVMGSNPSYFNGSRRPVEQVSWNKCQDFVTKLNSLTGNIFRLPTEAEWEYAARGGNNSLGYKYSGSNTIDDVAWYLENSNHGTHNVAQKSPNELGLYDMSGNVEEWCQDRYGHYGSTSQTNPTGPSYGSRRMYRGGRWTDYASGCRVSIRRYESTDFWSNKLGLRLAL